MSNQQFRTLFALHLFTISVIYSAHDAKIMGLLMLYASLAVAWQWWPFRRGFDTTDKQEQDD